MAADEPSGHEAGDSYEARRYGALVDRLMTSDPADWFVFGSCPRSVPPEPSRGSPAGSYEAYADKVVAAERNYERVGVSAYGWLNITNFKQLADAGVRSPDFCVRFLSEKKYSERQRHIALLSMYGLSIEQHVAFVRDLARLRDRGLISPEELMGGLLPRFSTMMVYENYQAKGIQSLLREMEARDDIDASFKSQIFSILSGEALEERRLFDRECCTVLTERILLRWIGKPGSGS